MRVRMLYLVGMAGLFVFVGLAWNMTARAGYESAQYKVIEKDGNIEIRQYPDLMLASTESKFDSQGKDGSFMRLFGYISGANESDQKIQMTTPVFMERDDAESNATMGFVMPEKVASCVVPKPTSSDVAIRKRDGGRFAVIRFTGRMNTEAANKQEATLRKWMELRGLKGDASAETAGYDPPFTPGPLRRNEILIRLGTEALPASSD